MKAFLKIYSAFNFDAIHHTYSDEPKILFD